MKEQESEIEKKKEEEKSPTSGGAQKFSNCLF